MTEQTTALPVICFGDALVDLLQDKDDKGQTILRQFAGGAPANVAAGVAKLGYDGYFAGGVGADGFGKFLAETLATAKVNVDMLRFSEKGPTGVAIVTLDEQSGEREFAFYRHNAAYGHYTAEDFNSDAFQRGGFFHFVSNIITTEELEKTTLAGIEKTHKNGGLVSFDVNYREGFWDNEEDAKRVVEVFLKHADIIKLSEEELHWLVPNTFAQYAYIEKLINDSDLPKLVILTRGEKGANYYTPTTDGTIAGFAANAVDATAAGDSFVAGLLSQMAKENVNQTSFLNYITTYKVEDAIRYGCACGSIAVSRYGAIPSLPTAEEVAELLEKS